MIAWCLQAAKQAGTEAGKGSVSDEIGKIQKYKLAKRAGATRPALLIPRSTIFIEDGAWQAGAAGTYGTVVPAQLELMSKVAVKLYDCGKLGLRDKSKALREALVLNRLSHPNVVRCLGIVDDPDSESSESIDGSLVMEWVEGGQLYTWLQEMQALPLNVRLGIAQQVAAGMRHLHSCKVMHGDLKPENVLLRQQPATVTDCPQVRHRPVPTTQL
jgi:hypothetical protein